MEEESWQAIKELFENAEANTDDMLEHQEKELWQAVRKLFKDAEANTNDILNVVSAIEDKSTPPHTQNGPKDWPEEIEEFRFQPAGNRAPINQMDLPLNRPDQMETNKDVEAKDDITHSNEGSRPEAGKENDAAAGQERKIDIIDSDTDMNAIKN